MLDRSLRAVGSASITIALLLCARTPAEAVCTGSRQFGLLYSIYAEDSIAVPQRADFWALGSGNPLLGIGDDSGSVADSYYWFNPYGVSGDWSHAGVDGCVDNAGASQDLDLDECMAVLLSGLPRLFQGPPTGHFGLFTIEADQPVYYPHMYFFSRRIDGSPPGKQPCPPGYCVPLAPIPRPTVEGSSAGDSTVDIEVRLGPGLPSGLFLEPDCGPVLEGYEVFVQEVPAGAEPPSSLLASSWESATPVTPFGTSAELTLDCTSGNDMYAAVRPVFVDGFATGYVSRPSERLHTATDADGDGNPDLCDICTDPDADGFGDPGFDSRTCAPDNCGGVFNPDQLDVDDDGVGDACDRCAGNPDPLPVLLTADMGLSATDYTWQFEVTPDGSRLIYLGAFLEPEGFNLWVRSTEGDPPLRLNDPLPFSGDVTDFAISPDGAWVVYRADQDTEDVYELFSVRSAGGTPPVKLNGPMVPGGDVQPRVFEDVLQSMRGYEITPDGMRVLYLADQDTDRRRELYTVSIDGSSNPVKLNSPTAEIGVRDFQLSVDGALTVFRSNVPGSNALRLWAAPADGSGLTRQISDPIQTPFDSVREFRLSPDGMAVVYRVTGTFAGLRRVSTAGGPTSLISATGHDASITADSAHIVFWDDDPSGPNGVFSVPIDGGVPIRLNADLLPEEDIHDFRLGPDGSRVVYRAGKMYFYRGLFEVAVDGGPVTRLSDADLDVTVYRISPDGLRLAFLGRFFGTGISELFGISILGGATSRLTGEIQSDGDVNDDFAFTPDSSSVVYRGDLTVDRLDELYVVPITGGTSLKLSARTLPQPVRSHVLDPAGGFVIFDAAPGLLRSRLYTGDGDLDGTVDPCDNCPFLANADQDDADIDGAGDGCDCAPLDPQARTPDEVRGLALDRGVAGVIRMTWESATGADAYAITRAELSALTEGNYGACLVRGIDGTDFEDTEDPAPGQGFAYLIQGEDNTCGLGSLGLDFHGVPRSNTNPAACSD